MGQLPKWTTWGHTSAVKTHQVCGIMWEEQVKGWLRASMWYEKELGLGAPRAKFGILRTTHRKQEW